MRRERGLWRPRHFYPGFKATISQTAKIYDSVSPYLKNYTLESRQISVVLCPDFAVWLEKSPDFEENSSKIRVCFSFKKLLRKKNAQRRTEGRTGSYSRHATILTFGAP